MSLFKKYQKKIKIFKIQAFQKKKSKEKVRRIILNLAPIQIAESMPGVLGAGMQTIVNIPNGIYIMRRHKDI